jgi:hypothetical protein
VDTRLRAKIGGLALSASRDPKVYSAAARQALNDSFLKAIDPSLPEPERMRRAVAARRLFYARLALKSAQARAKRRAGAEDAAEDAILADQIEES